MHLPPCNILSGSHLSVIIFESEENMGIDFLSRKPCHCLEFVAINEKWGKNNTVDYDRKPKVCVCCFQLMCRICHHVARAPPLLNTTLPLGTQTDTIDDILGVGCVGTLTNALLWATLVCILHFCVSQNAHTQHQSCF